MILYSSPSSYYLMIAHLASPKMRGSVRNLVHHLALDVWTFIWQKSNLSPWYLKLNPAMMVPTLTDANESRTDSQSGVHCRSSMV